MKTATEVSGDNSALMRNIKRREHVLEKALIGTCRTVLAALRSLSTLFSVKNDLHVDFNVSSITDTGAEKQQDMAEVAADIMGVQDYREKLLGRKE